MDRFWTRTPEWQREQELHAEVEAATKAMEEAGERILACVRIGAVAPDGEYWRERRGAYLDAVEAYEEAFAAWKAALDAFNASPAGRARARFLGDPLAGATTEGEVAA